jgi:hypothetical protein
VKKRIADPANSMHTGTNASRAICNVAFIALLPLFEIARVLVRLDHVARCIVNANKGIV